MGRGIRIKNGVQLFMRVRVNNGQSYCNDGPAIDSHDDMMRNSLIVNLLYLLVVETANQRRMQTDVAIDQRICIVNAQR